MNSCGCFVMSLFVGLYTHRVREGGGAGKKKKSTSLGHGGLGLAPTVRCVWRAGEGLSHALCACCVCRFTRCCFFYSSPPLPFVSNGIYMTS